MPLRRTKRAIHAKGSAIADEFGRFLRTETIGGAIMLGATVLALVWANSPWSATYTGLRDTTIGPASLHLDLTVEAWASDGLLAVFFFVAGLELKRELVVGELRRLRTAMLPVFAALGGMVVPAVVCLAISWDEPGADRAWAIPVATDIAFALAVLAITASKLPRSLRIFLLSLAVVDDLGAILLIAIVFTDDIQPLWLLAALGLLVGYAVLHRLRVAGRWSALLYVPIAVATWLAVHESGIHATVAGVLLALLTRVRRDQGEDEAPGARLEHRLQPWSAGIAVPVFALFAAGVPLDGESLGAAADDRIAWAVAIGLIVGKAVGVLGGASLASALKLARLPRGLTWRDIAAVGALAGIGFTVSLLLAELAFADPGMAERAKTAVLVASTVASLLGAAFLRIRVRRQARHADAEE